MAYPLDRSHFNSLERIAPSVVFDVPADIPTFLLDVAFFLPAFRTTLVSFAALLNPDWTLPGRRCYCVVGRRLLVLMAFTAKHLLSFIFKYFTRFCQRLKLRFRYFGKLEIKVT